ncbi:hypothetical protein RRG08_051895 [Elysia crispata]|uniref:Uncharacterized protein n=1 Tax=Elysia crispata TaxID=231223 RepID=A0AAE0Y1R2_9GAST|nr:hypothetical protein RRG08_051895 [Elysia crispata]
MATRMSKSSYLVKEKILQQLKEEFICKLESFMADVTTSIKCSSKIRGNEIFEMSIDILSQDFPDVRQMKAERLDHPDEMSNMKQEVRSLSEKLDKEKTNFERFRAQNDIRLNKIDERIDVNVDQVGCIGKLRKFLKAKFETDPDGVAVTTSIPATIASSPTLTATVSTSTVPKQKAGQTAHKMTPTAPPTSPTLTATVSTTSTVPKQKAGQTAHKMTPTAPPTSPTLTATVSTSTVPKQKAGQTAHKMTPTAPPTSPTLTATVSTTSTVPKQKAAQTAHKMMPTATAASPRVAASSASWSFHRQPKPLRERKNVSVELPYKKSKSDIVDVLLLSNTLILMADRSNESVKLYDVQGEHLHSLELSACPHRLAVIDSGPANTWNVAVTFLIDQRIAILKVTPKFVVQLISIQTTRKYHAITEADGTPLAVGCHGWIHLIDVAGRVLGRLHSPLDPWYMTVTQDGCLFMSTRDDTVAKVRIKDGQIIFNQAVPEIEKPAGVATLQDGRFVVSDWNTRSLHLVTPDGQWDRELWRHPRGCHRKETLFSVSFSCGMLVAVTRRGRIHVFDF